MLTVSIILVVGGLVTAIVALMGKCPAPVSPLLLSVAMLLQLLPKG